MFTLILAAAVGTPDPPPVIAVVPDPPPVAVVQRPERLKVYPSVVPEVATDRPFPSSGVIMPGTTARLAVDPSTSFPAGALGAVTTTPARRVIRGGTVNCGYG